MPAGGQTLGMHVWRAEPDEFDAVMALAREFDPGVDPAGVAPLLADDSRGVIWLAGHPLAAAGYAVVTWGWSVECGGPEAVLDEIHVRDGDRNRGVGSGLIAHLLADCRARGIKRIFLETEAPNERARQLYERHGFVAEDSVWMARRL